MAKNKSLVHQVKEVLYSKLRIGESKHLAKQSNEFFGGIYSWGTYRNYLAKSCAFVKWTKEQHGCKTLEESREYVDKYLQSSIDLGYSPYTQKHIACALAKLYECSTTDFIKTQTRHRRDITRSRMGKAKFSESKNQEFVDFCKATGLRRHEIKYLKPENLRYDESAGRHMLMNIKGKGGRLRDCPILSTKALERIQNTPAGQNVWSKIPSRADIHSYRIDYCNAIYNIYAQPTSEIPMCDRYYCRSDRKGVVYDRHAMRITSTALGHNRISVIAGHYLYNQDASYERL